MKKELSIEQKRADKDLNIIILATIVPLLIYSIYGNKIMDLAKSESINIWLRFVPLSLIQFGLAGLGASLVMLYRREKFASYGLRSKGFFKALGLTAFVCLPALAFMVFNNEIDSYLPFQGFFLTREFLQSGFPSNLLGYGFIALIWGFFEGFNYVLIGEKINQRYASKKKWLNYGALGCGLACILIHGMIGLDLHTILEALSTFILIYGMLVIKEKTGNAWACIMVFLFFWNAF